MLVSSTLLYSSSSCTLRAGRPRLDASGGDTFARGVDLLQLSKDKRVTARQVVNVLGRWQEYSDWNEGIGTKGKLDEYRSGDYYEDDVKALKTDFTQPIEYYISRRPQFINFCERYGLVARWVHNENVGQLPFTDEALAASIGATVEELNQERRRLRRSGLSRRAQRHAAQPRRCVRLRARAVLCAAGRARHLALAADAVGEL
jgi:hypothetical protein